jgi:hypothetical protein
LTRQRGIGELVGEVLRENEPMLQMCRELGFLIVSQPADPPVMLVRKSFSRTDKFAQNINDSIIRRPPVLARPTSSP